LQNDLLRQARAAGETLAAETPKLAAGAATVGNTLYTNGVDQANSLVESGKRLWNAAGDRIGQAGDSVQGAAHAAGKTTRRGLVSTRRFVRHRPVASLAIALAAGMVIRIRRA
jgi:ElaB/YqjD/DUF883 family membrane-anchored ribosome-binding protein